jgi:SAM-dependent methyltransferase
MNLDPTQRFSSRVENYVRYRPSYPSGLMDLLARECGLTFHSRVADIGSGTGLLARLFLDIGCEVLGVEPNPGMRQAEERLLAQWPRFRSVDGRAEATTLPDCSVDFVTAAQAFHWFECGTSACAPRDLWPLTKIWSDATGRSARMWKHRSWIASSGARHGAWQNYQTNNNSISKD